MTAGVEQVLWSHHTDEPAPGRPRALLAGAALLMVAVFGIAGGVRSPGLVPLLGLALIAGPCLLLAHLIRSRRRRISRVWTEPGRPGVVLVRRAGGVVQAINPARVRRIRVVRTTGSYRDERPGEPGEWHSYALVRMTLRAGLVWYATPDQTLPDGTGAAQFSGRLAAAFPNARISQRDLHLSSQDSAE
ncbi:hypothetical protein [Dactylosporangium sp. NPDC050588]|uniref:hypothetical protein n=1 Tax=Dactylosporangium sp. NPDC050588 TaxID=3157211 RepID=UPI00340991A9